MKRFDIITEADARTLDVGATVELVAGGQVTPLAKDTLAARRITVIPLTWRPSPTFAAWLSATTTRGSR